MYLILAILLLAINFTHGINWNGNNWALNCDFIGNDLTSVQVRGEDCGGSCEATTGCTHFSWTNYNGGTCWMKKNGASKSDAIAKHDSGAVCGVIITSDDSQSLRGSTQNLDRCKSSCSCSGGVTTARPVSLCSRCGSTVFFDSNVQNGCGGRGASTCNQARRVQYCAWCRRPIQRNSYGATHQRGQFN